MNLRFLNPERKFSLKLILRLIACIVLSYSAFAYPGGYTGVTLGGCGSCHSGPNTAVTLALVSGSTNVAVGSTTEYTISSTRQGGTKIGFDVAVLNSSGAAMGTLATSASGFKLSNGEITHSAKISSTTGTANCTFSWTAPTTPGTYFINAVSTNGSGSKNAWNFMVPVAITVGNSSSYTVAPQAIAFASLKVGEYKDSSFVITNTGTSSVTIDSIIVTGQNNVDFKIPETVYPLVINQNSIKNVITRFIPLTAAAFKTATLNVYSSAGNKTIVLTGGASESGTSVLALSPTSIDFGAIDVNTTKDTTFKVYNNGNTDLHVSSMVLGGTDAKQFIVENLMQAYTINPGKFYTVKVTLAPKLTVTNLSAEISFNCDALDAPKMKFSGTVKPSTSATLTPSSNDIDFGDVVVNTTKDTTIVLANTGSAPLKVSSIGLGGMNPEEFSITSKGISQIPAGGKVNLTIRFAPTTIKDNKFGVVSFISEATNDPTIQIHGNGVATPTQNILVSESSLDYGKIAVGKFKDTTITVKNTGTTKLKITGVKFSGANASDFTAIGDWTKFVLAGGETQSFVVKFTPKKIAISAASLILESNALNTPSKIIPLNGEGVDPSSVEEELNSSISIYPNPANSFVNFELADLNINSIEIYNSFGDLVKTIKPTTNKFAWDLSNNNSEDVSNGTYLIKLISGDTSVIRKVNVIR